MKGTKSWNKKIGAGLAAASLTAAMMLQAMPVYAADSGIDMSTDYPGVMAKAGETVSFPLDFISTDGEGHDISLEALTLPEAWTGYFKGNTTQISKVHVNGTAEEDSTSPASFSLTIPDDAAEGTYEIQLKADAGSGDTDVLDLEVVISEEEAGESSFTSEYPQQQGVTGTTFTFDTTIVNNRGTNQSYSLAAQTPEGWQVTFTPSDDSKNVASLEVEAGSSKGMKVTVTPPENVEKGDYKIPVTAISSNDKLSTELTVSITGTYGVALSTPNQVLSFDAYANKESSVTLSITNSGNVALTNLNLTSSAPTDWNVSFSESTIDTLEPGATKEVTAYVTPSENAITGDYVTSFTVSSNETSGNADFRVSVKTSTTWGIAAAAIIVVLVAALAGIMKKYGRR